MEDATPVPSAPDLPPSYDVAAATAAAAAAAAAATATHTTTPLPSRPSSHPPRLPLPLDLPVLNALRGKRVILASASPRRKQLLAQIGLVHNVEIIPSSVPEDLPKSLSPFEYVLQTATRKAMTVYTAEIDNATRGEPALVLAADTVVVSQLGQILEKPRSQAEHVAMLQGLRDAGVHQVYTAVVAMAPLPSARDPGYALHSTVEETSVRFAKDVGDDLIMAYVKTREGADKAGGYGIQGIGAILVDRVDGSLNNVIGLPMRATIALIEKVLSQDDDLDVLEAFAEE